MLLVRLIGEALYEEFLKIISKVNPAINRKKMSLEPEIRFF